VERSRLLPTKELTAMVHCTTTRWPQIQANVFFWRKQNKQTGQVITKVKDRDMRTRRVVSYIDQDMLI
jgi:hypothetical protein